VLLLAVDRENIGDGLSVVPFHQLGALEALDPHGFLL
jgi:hypothetical protein